LVIPSPSPRDVQALVQQLYERDAVAREAAIARLRILGGRTVARLSALVSQGPDPVARASALQALEGIDDPRVPAVALRAVRDDDLGVRLAAIAALRPWVVREPGAAIIDVLVPAALDRSQPSAIRLAALDALSELPRDILQPVLDQTHREEIDPEAADDPGAVQEWLTGHADAPLSQLHGLIARAREREHAEPQASRRREWLAVRGAVHAALARRRSRVALYDLREAFDAAHAPLPLDFLAAMAALGDAECLEPLARAWAAAPATEGWWRSRLVETAAGIVRAHRLTGRHAAVKRVRLKWRGFV
jgi:hypothetical protein